MFQVSPKRLSVLARLSAGIVFTAVALVSPVHLVGQTTTLPRVMSVTGDQPDTLRQLDRLVTARARSGELTLRSTLRDPLVPTRIVERYEQRYGGVRVWGAELIRDSADGVPISFFGMVVPDSLPLPIQTTQALTSSEADRRAIGLFGPSSRLLVAPELVILPVAEAFHLAHTFVVAHAQGVDRVFVDAVTGAELLRYTELQGQDAPVVGVGTGVLGDQKKLSVASVGATYIAFDTHRPPVLRTFDFRHIWSRFVNVVFGSLPFALSDYATDADNVWTDPGLVDAHAHIAWTYDFFYKRFARSGLDDRDSPINIAVNAISQADGPRMPDEIFDQFVVNAFYCGACLRGQGVMYFGNGMPSSWTLGGRTWGMLSGSLDVAAHELTHGITYNTSRLIYSGESGALNEAFSDMMGKAVEFYFHKQVGSSPGQADYTIGKDVVRTVRAGTPSGLRSMSDPQAYGHPDHYSRRYLGTADYGGVHINSGIANNAFYLAIEGGQNRTSGVTVQGVGAANREQIEKVFFRAFTALLPANATFSTAKAATTQAARDLYGVGSAVERAVIQAWTAVGVS